MTAAAAAAARGRNFNDIATADKPPHRVISTHNRREKSGRGEENGNKKKEKTSVSWSGTDDDWRWVATTATTILFNGMFYGRSEWAANEKLWSEVATASDHKAYLLFHFQLRVRNYGQQPATVPAIFCQRK